MAATLEQTKLKVALAVAFAFATLYAHAGTDVVIATVTADGRGCMQLATLDQGVVYPVPGTLRCQPVNRRAPPKPAPSMFDKEIEAARAKVPLKP